MVSVSSAAPICRDGGRNRRIEEDPHMPAVTGAGALKRGRYPALAACLQKRRRVLNPIGLVEIGSEEPAGPVGKQRIDANDIIAAANTASTQMPADYLVGYRDEGLMRTFSALHRRFYANSALPFICTGWRISGARRFHVLPAYRIVIGATLKEATKQGDFYRGRRSICDRCPRQVRLRPYRFEGGQLLLKVGKSRIETDLLTLQLE